MAVPTDRIRRLRKTLCLLPIYDTPENVCYRECGHGSNGLPVFSNAGLIAERPFQDIMRGMPQEKTAESSKLRLYKTFLLGWTLAVTLVGHAAPPSDRLAVIVGNNDYQQVSKLRNPINDARAISQFLKDQNFEVHEFINLNKEQISNVRTLLEKRTTPDTTVFFFFAGHGVQVNQRNYLLPVDVRAAESDQLADDSLYLGDILHALEKRRPKLGVVILDACRDDPFKGSKKAASGLARVDPPSSTVVFYATRPGGVASDGVDANGLFTREFLSFARSNKAPLEVLFRQITNSVYKSSKGEQEPWLEGAIREEFIFGEPTPSVVAHRIEPNVFAKTSWTEALRSIDGGSTADFETTPTRFYCDDGECMPYQEWAKSLRQTDNVKVLSEKLAQYKNAKFMRVCEFNLQTGQCDTENILFTIANPLMLFTKGFFNGFEITSPSVTTTGTLNFTADPKGGSKWFGSGTVNVSCKPAIGKMDFGSDQAGLTISRTSCFGVTPSTVKVDLRVLAIDVQNKRFVARYDFGMFAGLAAARSSGIALATFE